MLPAARGGGADQTWHAFDAAARARTPQLVEALLGKPAFRTRQEWRWGRKGSLSVVIGGARAGMWFDHEAGEGGGLVALVARSLDISRSAAIGWIADRIGVPEPSGQRAHRASTIRLPANDIPARSAARQGDAVAADDTDADAADPTTASRAEDAAARAARIWTAACPAPANHPYLVARQAAPLALRVNAGGQLIVPLQDADGRLHSLEFIAPDATKRYLAGGAKRGHFAVVGTSPAALAEPQGPLLVCEGWATGASLAMATGHTVIAAMDAGNLLPVAETLRRRFAQADLVIVADNDARPDRNTNPGLAAARKAALAVDARIAVPPCPGDANDLYRADGAGAIAALIAAAAKIPPLPPTYPAPMLSPQEARSALADAIARFMAAIPAYWAAVEAALEAAEAGDDDRDRFGFERVTSAPPPPLLALPVDVGLGKTSHARAAIAGLIASAGLGNRKVVYAVPRHDLGAEQVAAFQALGIEAMLWKGRTAADPTEEDPERLMCLDPQATFDALEIEQAVEQSCCKVKRDGVIHVCPHYHRCGYQAQKRPARAAQLIVCAHDSLFHAKPAAIGEVGLLVIDEAFWQSGLRGLDGKLFLTQDSLEPDVATLSCHDRRGRVDYEATNDLLVARAKLWKVLCLASPGPLGHGVLTASGLSAQECRHAAGLERARLRDPHLLPGMDANTRRKRMARVLPPQGAPWAPPGRAAAMWAILAEALEGAHDAAGVELGHERTDNGSVRALKLRWRSRLRAGWEAEAPILHLDATLRPELVQTWLPLIDIGAPVAARQPHVRIRQVTGSPTSARALTPAPAAPERDHRAAANHLRDLGAWIALRARQCHRPAARVDLLVVGQKATIDALRAAGLPPRVEAVHFNALSGLDRWGDIAGMIVIGRTLPAPRTVELIAMALTGRVPAPNPEDAGWWYPMAERRIRMAGERTAPLSMEAHADATAEAVRWSICEGELIQAIGRGRGVNRTADTALEIDLMTDVVLPVTVDALVPWSDLKPARRDLMALCGIILDNAADMAACFPDLWPSAEAARQDRSRSVTNCYYRDLYNSQMSHSSVEVTWRPAGAGHRVRTARVDLARIPDPQTWLTERLGPLASFEIRHTGAAANAVPDPGDPDRLDALATRLTASMQAVVATRRAALDALAARLDAAVPVGRRPTSPPITPPQQENDQ